MALHFWCLEELLASHGPSLVRLEPPVAQPLRQLQGDTPLAGTLTGAHGHVVGHRVGSRAGE